MSLQAGQNYSPSQFLTIAGTLCIPAEFFKNIRQCSNIFQFSESWMYKNSALSNISLKNILLRQVIYFLIHSNRT